MRTTVKNARYRPVSKTIVDLGEGSSPAMSDLYRGLTGSLGKMEPTEVERDYAVWFAIYSCRCPHRLLGTR